MATRAKEHAFPVAVEWEGARTVRVRIPGKDPLAVATPPAFHQQADPRVWSPEDLVSGAAATCLAVTIAGAAERDELVLDELWVHATGIVGIRADGRYGFKKMEQRVRVAVAAQDEERARRIVEQAESTCLVAASLDFEVETTIEVLAFGAAARPGLGDARFGRADD